MNRRDEWQWTIRYDFNLLSHRHHTEFVRITRMFELSTNILQKKRGGFNLFDVRLQTFIFYQKTSISSHDMASTGFYYTGEDRVQKCFGCKSTVTCFHEGDDPFITGHRSGCPFVHATKRTENTVAAAATVEHSLSPLGETHHLKFFFIRPSLGLGHKIKPDTKLKLREHYSITLLPCTVD